MDLEQQGTNGSGNRLLVEAVLSRHNPLTGATVKEGRFR